MELKATHRRLDDAYTHNLTDYRKTIPQLFWYNAVVILSNGSHSRAGSMTAAWEHFGEWKRINSEGEQGIISLDTMIRGVCRPDRLLDIVENFTLFSDAKGTLVKLLARNHQFLGVNNAIEAVRRSQASNGRLGVFWHTQGSGKSYSMVFFSQKVLRTIPGNHTFLIVTDRQELDEQIYKTFAAAGAVTEKHVQATSGAHLKTLLGENHRNIFTLIQKFGAEPGAAYPKLSDRSDIIVMTDEAHRSQYDTFALNMRTALPNAAFIGFTGTPLMAGEEKTREVFGDYVSVYNFKQSVDDGATVPLFYENRIPELQIINDDLNRQLYDVIDAAGLDDDQERKLERQFAREYHLITRNDRLETIAKDIVAHFMGCSNSGKAMVISIDKATAVRMYNKVQTHWLAEMTRLRKALRTASLDEQATLKARLAGMEATDMAVVVSASQNEGADFDKLGLDITPHRRRMVKQDLETHFKDADHPLRIVFVCAMWITGFDVPSLSTIYLDKPMRNHTLMQAIARANRVFAGKTNGLIVDYIGIFRDLQQALALYGSVNGSNGELPVQSKAILVAALRDAIAGTEAWCMARAIDLAAITASTGFQRIRLLDDAVDAILINDETKRAYLALAATVTRLYRAILPDPTANEFAAIQTLVGVLASKILSLIPAADIASVTDDIAQVLDRSIVPGDYLIAERSATYNSGLVNLSQIDFEALKKEFAEGHQHTQAEKLRGAVSSKLRQMLRVNKSRIDYLDRFQQLIDDYNAGKSNVVWLFQQLIAFTQDLSVEEQRAMAEHLTEEELSLFDVLSKPDLQLSEQERDAIKKVARALLQTLKETKLVLDWRKRQVSRAEVRVTIEQTLDKGLPPSFSAELFQQKCDLVFNHVFDSYYGLGHSIYARAA